MCAYARANHYVVKIKIITYWIKPLILTLHSIVLFIRTSDSVSDMIQSHNMSSPPQTEIFMPTSIMIGGILTILTILGVASTVIVCWVVKRMKQSGRCVSCTCSTEYNHIFYDYIKYYAWDKPCALIVSMINWNPFVPNATRSEAEQTDLMLGGEDKIS